MCAFSMVRTGIESSMLKKIDPGRILYACRDDLFRSARLAFSGRTGFTNFIPYIGKACSNALFGLNKRCD